MERKLATVLFVDLVDSTALVGAVDPEVVRRRVREYFDEASACIEQHGGMVEKFAGDAVMAAFGVPRTHEDDAQRAAARGVRGDGEGARPRPRCAHRRRGRRGRRRRHRPVDVRDGRGREPGRAPAAGGAPGRDRARPGRAAARRRLRRGRGRRPDRGQGTRRAALDVARDPLARYAARCRRRVVHRPRAGARTARERDSRARCATAARASSPSSASPASARRG